MALTEKSLTSCREQHDCMLSCVQCMYAIVEKDRCQYEGISLPKKCQRCGSGLYSGLSCCLSSWVRDRYCCSVLSNDPKAATSNEHDGATEHGLKHTFIFDFSGFFMGLLIIGHFPTSLRSIKVLFRGVDCNIQFGTFVFIKE